MELTSRIFTCTCAVIHWCSLANSSCIFFESASLTCTDVFNWLAHSSGHWLYLSCFFCLPYYQILRKCSIKAVLRLVSYFQYFQKGELEEKVVCRKFRQTTQHGALEGKTQSKDVKYYNLDVIISVGYRVKNDSKVHVPSPSAIGFVSFGHRIRLLQPPHSTPSATAAVCVNSMK